MKPKNLLRTAQLNTIAELKASLGVQAVLGMGAGKTVSALTAIDDMIGDGLIGAAIVTAPRTVAIETWPTEIAEWEHTKDIDLVVLEGNPARRAKLLAEDHDIYVIGHDNLIWLVDELNANYKYDDRRWDLLCIDELSKFKSARGKRAKKLARVSEKFGAIWGMSGTPKPNTWEDQWMQLNLISAGTAWGGKSFDDWRRAYFRPLDYQQRSWAIHDFAIPILRRTIDTWSFTIPPSQLSDVPFTAGDDHDFFVDLTDEALADLETLEKELFVELGREGTDLREDDEEIMLVLAKAQATGKMEQILQGFLYRDGQTLQTYRNPKIEMLERVLDDVGGEPVLIPYYFKEDLEAVRSILPGAPHLGAGVNDVETKRLIAAWNAGDIERLLIHPASAGHGLNLQKGPGHRLVWYTPTWSAEMYAQTVKRLARPGQAAPVWSHRIRARHWLDDLKINRVEHKLKEQADFIDQMRKV